MKKFFVLFAIPAAAIQEWVANVDEATRKEQTDKLMSEWEQWKTDHATSIVENGLPLGKTKRVMADGVTDAKNDLNWFMIVQAESQDEAAKMFVGHPHLQIPSSYIEVMGTEGPASN